MTVYNSAIIGLGNIGFLFDLDKKRKTTWSHAAAYRKCKRTKLVAAVEIDPVKIGLFHERYKNVPVYSSTEKMMENHSVDIVSICTPTNTHCTIAKNIVNYPVKAIFCEKPLAGSIQEGQEIVDLCRKHNVVLAVNHTRRWDAYYVHAREKIISGRIGRITAINALYAGNIFNIGTHLVDAMLMLLNADKIISASGIITDENPLDPSVSGWFRTSDNIFCSVVWTGRGRDLIFEIDVIGTEGRVRIVNNGSEVGLFQFRKSTRYEAYRELKPLPAPNINIRDRLVYSLNDIAGSVDNQNYMVKCSGEDALLAMKICHAMVASAQKSGIPVEVR